ncbi:polyketide synthase dehydratase domain-containing protein [Variovorax sp. NFACC27]|uniref:polyketide synthase dehydratase domain-containing protein n=1 Tax=Variovorax sp. NFACC27 TaxID=1566274 RepID=UPI003AAFF06E
MKGQRVLPGVAYLELARAAVVQALELAASQARDVRLEQVVFAQPVVVGDAPVEVHIALVPQDGGSVSFEVYTQVAGEEEARVHAQGRARVAAAADAPIEDLDRLRSQCPQVFASEACYAEFARMGLAYGPAFQSLMEVRVGQDAAGRLLAVGELALPSKASESSAAFMLPPGLLGAALQASMGRVTAQPQDEPLRPFAMEAVDTVALYGPVPAKAVAVVRQGVGGTTGGALPTLDVSLTDMQGRVCVWLQGVRSRTPDGVPATLEVEQVVPGVSSVAEVLPRATAVESPVDMSAETKQTLDNLLAGLLWGQLCELGLASQPVVDVEAWKARVGLPSLYGPWLVESLEVLEKRGIWRVKAAC